MKKVNPKIIFIVATVCFMVVLGDIFIYKNYLTVPGQKDNTPRNGTFLLTEKEARTIAERSCIKGGEALSPGYYNENSKTWWFEANLNATRPGCTPACVVSEETKTAEINWRCTGLQDPNDTPCGIENCHGLDIVCGPNPAQICTEIYQLGDKCRQFAECGAVNGSCQFIENPQFTACKNCVETCEKDNLNNPELAFTCESKCGE